MHFGRGLWLEIRNAQILILASPCKLRLRFGFQAWSLLTLAISGEIIISINHWLRYSLLIWSNFQLLPSVIKTLCSLIVRFKSIRSFAGAQVRLSLVVDSLWRMSWSIGRGWSTVYKAAAPVAINACVLGIGRHRRSGDSSSSELELIWMANTSCLASSYQICSCDSWRST